MTTSDNECLNIRKLIKLSNKEELSGILNVLIIALRSLLRKNGIYVSEKTIDQRRERYELAVNPVQSFINDAVARDSVDSDRTTKEQLYQAYRRFCKNNKLAVESKETFGKILKSKHRFEDGREPSGERKTVWKGVRLIERYSIDQEQQILAA